MYFCQALMPVKKEFPKKLHKSKAINIKKIIKMHLFVISYNNKIIKELKLLLV